jgi:predicted choloylglycine hydrolase
MVFKCDWKRRRRLAVVFLLVVTLSGCQMYRAFNHIVNLQEEYREAKEDGVARLEYYESMPILHLYGSYAEMGEQYGTILHEQLNSLVVISKGLFSDKKLEKYYMMADEVEPVVPEDIRLFIEGMAKTSGVSYRKLLALNIVPRTTCSVLAVWGEATADGEMLMGRNADYNFQRVNKALGLIVVKHPDEGLATISSTFLGLAGSFTGMNEKGVSYGNMLVYNSEDNGIDTNGLPIQLLMQMGGEQSGSAKSMVKFLRDKRHMIPINVMCADSDEAFVAELSPIATAVREGTRGVLAATNYFYASGMFESHVNERRFANLMTLSKKYHGEFNLEHLREAMHEARQLNENLQCVLFEPAKMKMHVSMNRVPASAGPFTEFDVEGLLNE